MKKMLCIGMIAWCFALATPMSGFSAVERASAATVKQVNINTATAMELETLPGIGPVSAQRIVEHRREKGPFTAIDQLVDVKGIGEKSLEKIRSLVVVK